MLIRAKAGRNPQVLEAFREDGKRVRSLRPPSLPTIHATLAERSSLPTNVPQAERRTWRTWRCSGKRKAKSTPRAERIKHSCGATPPHNAGLNKPGVESRASWDLQWVGGAAEGQRSALHAVAAGKKEASEPQRCRLSGGHGPLGGGTCGRHQWRLRAQAIEVRSGGAGRVEQALASARLP